MKLEWSAFLTGVVLPYESAAPAVERAKVPVARADEDEIPRDRRGREDSPTGVESPGVYRFLRGAEVGRA